MSSAVAQRLVERALERGGGSLDLDSTLRLLKGKTAQTHPDELAAALAARSGQLTSRAADVYQSFEAARAAGNLEGWSPAPALPDWYPQGWDLAEAARGAKQVLVDQGLEPGDIGPGRARSLSFYDADLTLLQTSTPALLSHKSTGRLVTIPGTREPMMLAVGPRRSISLELEAWKQRYPDLDWNDIQMDYREFASVAEVLRTPFIPEGLASLRQTATAPGSRAFLVTARNRDTTIDAMKTVLERAGVTEVGVLSPGLADHRQAMHLDAPNVTPARGKALEMAATIMAFGGPAWVREVPFFDDTDENLKAAWELLPKLFPTIRFRFADVVHPASDGPYQIQVVAESRGRRGELQAASGRPFTVDAMNGYQSLDEYPQDVRLLGTASRG